MTEEWRKIPGFPNYSVTRDGRVRNDDRGNMLRGSSRQPQISLRQGGERHQLHPGHLVAMAFRDRPAPSRLKLTEEDVDGILALRHDGATQQSIADRYGVSQNQVSLICRGRSRRRL